MKFTIITPTHNRPALLLRAVESVTNQSHTDWEMIVVNDNPGDGAAGVIREINDARITFLENESNSGVNISRNRGLDTVSSDSNYVIFLDDDDYLAPEALASLVTLINEKSTAWLMTAVGSSEDNSLTNATRGSGEYRYVWDYLIAKKITGDATHCIATNLLNGKLRKIRFPTRIKQAEEWLFYFELSQHATLQYHQKVTKFITDYSTTGLNLRQRGTGEQLHTLRNIFKEAHQRKLTSTISFWVYFAMRFVRAFVK